MKKKYKKILFQMFVILNVFSLFLPSASCFAQVNVIVDNIPLPTAENTISQEAQANLTAAAITASLPPANASAMTTAFNSSYTPVFLIAAAFAGYAFVQYYNIEEDEVRSAMDTVNNLEYKVQVPEVEIVFQPAVPIPGKKVIAFAQTKNFKNSANNFFYTWMLKHDDNIDVNHITDDDLEEYKKNAARIIANAGFDFIEAAQNGKYEDSTYDPDNDGYKASDFFGGDDQKGKRRSDYHCFAFDRTTGLFYPNDRDGSDTKKGFECEHLFPKECDGYELGDEKFKAGEEKCWQTDPEDEDTKNSGHPDEANVLGLGATSFSWTYKDGDKVGLAVEGVSNIPTKLKDGSYKIMWAISGEGCPHDDDILDVDDINDKCLPNSFVDPTEKKSGEKIDVTLDYLPDFPTNSANIINEDLEIGERDSASDLLSITASISEKENFQNLSYEWKVYAVDDPESTDLDDWDLLSASELKYPTPLSGPGVDKLNFGLFFEDPPNFLKVSVKVTESSSSGKIREGSAYVIIPIASEKELLKVYSASADQNLNLSTPGEAGCLNPNKICQVTKNEILAVEANSSAYQNFHWTINGESITFNPGGEASDNKIYFPVKESVGKEFTLTMTANKNTVEKEKVEIKKNFAVVEPGLEIFCPEKNLCDNTILGYFTDLEGSRETPDYSEKNFEAKADSDIILKADFFGPSEADLNRIQWILPDSSLKSGNEITFKTEEADNSYTIEAKMLYTPSVNIKRALANYWNISYDQYYEKEISSKIYIETVDIVNYESGIKLGSSNKKPLASLISGIPVYLIFLLKLLLTLGLLIFSLGIFYSLTFNREGDNY